MSTSPESDGHSPVPEMHRRQAPQTIQCAVLTVSDTRSRQDDRGGDAVTARLKAAGHEVADRQICPDDPSAIGRWIEKWVADDAIAVILLTGGTGIGPRDQTYETIATRLTKRLPGYGELFRWLSYQEIGTAAMLSRAIGGVIADTIVLTMPGSPAAVKLAMEKVILPELGHLVQQARPRR